MCIAITVVPITNGTKAVKRGKHLNERRNVQKPTNPTQTHSIINTKPRITIATEVMSAVILRSLSHSASSSETSVRIEMVTTKACIASVTPP